MTLVRATLTLLSPGRPVFAIPGNLKNWQVKCQNRREVRKLNTDF